MADETPKTEPTPAASTPPVTPATPEPMKTDSSYDSAGGNYGKKTWGKWIVIYLVIAIIVYGVIYYLIKQHGASTGSTGLGY